MSTRKYFWDETFWDHQDPITAYFGGFSFADACLEKKSLNGYRLSYKIHTKDISHLILLSSSIGLSNPHLQIRSRWKPNDQVVLSLNSTKMAEGLKQWGVQERKTYNFLEPSFPKELTGAWLRGVLDGDGWIAKDRRLISITAYSPLLFDWIRDNVRGIDFSVRNKSNKSGTSWELTVRAKSVYGFLEFIDWTNPLRLDRKYSHIDPTFTHWRKKE